jgi:diaminopimelate epimerase
MPGSAEFIGDDVGALANQSFVKMNGIGNEIVVVDLRARAVAIAPEEVRAAAAPEGAPYDQLMALYPPRTPGTDAFIRIYNNDGSEAGAHAAMACAASPTWCRRRVARPR